MMGGGDGTTNIVSLCLYSHIDQCVYKKWIITHDAGHCYEKIY